MWQDCEQVKFQELFLAVLGVFACLPEQLKQWLLSAKTENSEEGTGGRDVDSRDQ